MNTKVSSGENKKADGVKINLEGAKDGKLSSIDCDVALVSIGRHAFTEGLDLAKAGLTANERGQVPINYHW